MGKYQKIREIIREVMKDGKVHTAEELERLCEKKGMYLYNNRAPIYNVVHQLKQKGEIVSDGENGYISVGDRENNIELRKKSVSDTTMNIQVDLSDFEIIKPAIRKRKKQVVSVFENGDIAFNDILLDLLAVKEIEMRIKKDCRQLLLIPGGEVKINIGKNSRFKNYMIYEKLNNQKVKFPVYYVGEWNEEEKYWLGSLTTVNPNKTVGKNK